MSQVNVTISLNGATHNVAVTKGQRLRHALRAVPLLATAVLTKLTVNQVSAVGDVLVGLDKTMQEGMQLTVTGFTAEAPVATTTETTVNASTTTEATATHAAAATAGAETAAAGSEASTGSGVGDGSGSGDGAASVAAGSGEQASTAASGDAASDKAGVTVEGSSTTQHSITLSGVKSTPITLTFAPGQRLGDVWKTHAGLPAINSLTIRGADGAVLDENTVLNGDGEASVDKTTGAKTVAKKATASPRSRGG